MPVDSLNVSKVLILDNDKFLVFKRKDNSKLDLPGGHVHVGEEMNMGAIREVYEELKIILLNCTEVVSYGNKKIFFSDSFTYANDFGGIELDTNENTEFYWMSSDDFLDIKINNATDCLVAAKSHIMCIERKKNKS